MNGEEEDEIQEPVTTYYYDYSTVDPPEMEECPACGGKGTYALLISVRPCEACGGTGKIVMKDSPPAGGSARPPQPDLTRSPEADPTPPGGLEQAGPPSEGSPESEDPSPSGWGYITKTYYEFKDNGDAAEPGPLLKTTERVRGHWVTTYTYDKFSRLVAQQEQFVPEADEGNAQSDAAPQF